MLFKKPEDLASSEITPEQLYLRRRDFIAGGVALAAVGAGVARAAGKHPEAAPPPPPAPRPAAPKPTYTVDEPLTSYEDATHYNNYYEFGTDKTDPAQNAKDFKPPRPWTVKVEGLVDKPMTLDLDQILKLVPPEDRVYRFRCVEAWSMVLPWTGVPLGALIKKLNPTSKAKYVEMTTLMDPAQMPGENTGVLPWPYNEGLRLDEALHPLTLLATGLYGKPLPNQNGAPLRLVVPWKYGFKGVKAIVRLNFREDQPQTTWNRLAPDEYGFYANVNPHHDHPRWSQAKERRIGEWRKRDTLMFNGYADQVASLYAGMDLDKYF